MWQRQRNKQSKELSVEKKKKIEEKKRRGRIKDERQRRKRRRTRKGRSKTVDVRNSPLDGVWTGWMISNWKAKCSKREDPSERGRRKRKGGGTKLCGLCSRAGSSDWDWLLSRCWGGGGNRGHDYLTAATSSSNQTRRASPAAGALFWRFPERKEAKLFQGGERQGLASRGAF